MKKLLKAIEISTNKIWRDVLINKLFAKYGMIYNPKAEYAFIENVDFVLAYERNK